MSKPHDETWALSGDGTEIRCGTSSNQLHLMRPAGVAQDKRIPRLAAQAPAMARALLKHVLSCEACGGTGLAAIRAPEGRNALACPACEDDRATLRAAGVLE